MKRVNSKYNTVQYMQNIAIHWIVVQNKAIIKLNKLNEMEALGHVYNVYTVQCDTKESRFNCKYNKMTRCTTR